MAGVFVIWLVMGIIVGMIASARGRDPLVWFLYGFLIWPVALIQILCTQPNVEELERRDLERLTPPAPWGRCSECGRGVRADAVRCDGCGARFTVPPSRV